MKWLTPRHHLPPAVAGCGWACPGAGRLGAGRGPLLGPLPGPLPVHSSFLSKYTGLQAGLAPERLTQAARFQYLQKIIADSLLIHC